MLEEWKGTVDKGKVSWRFATGLLKKFDCFDIEISNLNAYGFNLLALRLFYGYLLNRKQRIKLSSSYSN